MCYKMYAANFPHGTGKYPQIEERLLINRSYLNFTQYHTFDSGHDPGVTTILGTLKQQRRRRLGNIIRLISPLLANLTSPTLPFRLQEDLSFLNSLLTNLINHLNRDLSPFRIRNLHRFI